MSPSRPRSIPGLLWSLVRARPRTALALGLAAAMPVGVVLSCSGSELRVVTFNIRDFPESQGQIRGAMRELQSLDASVFAVQEITDPPLFERASREALGDEWRFVASDEGTHRTGVLFDASELELDWSRMHRETRIDDRGKPTLEVRLRRGSFADALRVFVVHLKAGGEHAALRREQMRALGPIVRAAVESGDEVMVLGDFNATGDEDRVSLARFADQTSLEWASRSLACTSYWDRNDGCQGSALDHVFTLGPRHVAARGPCEREGCAPRDRCPAFHREVSDHCPVSVDP